MIFLLNSYIFCIFAAKQYIIKRLSAGFIRTTETHGTTRKHDTHFNNQNNIDKSCFSKL